MCFSIRILVLLSALSLLPGIPLNAWVQSSTRTDAAGQPLVAAVDLPAWIESHFAAVSLPKMEWGSLHELFDRRNSTTACCRHPGPVLFEFIFQDPIEIHQLGITPGRDGIFRWDAWFLHAARQSEGRSPPVPLIERRHAHGFDRDLVRFPRGERIRGLRLRVERLTGGSELVLAEIEIYASVTLTVLELEHPGPPLIEGGSYTLGLFGCERHGGRIPLDEGVEWSLYPSKKLLSIGREGRAVALSPGKVEVTASFGRLRLSPVTLTIKGRDRSPGGLTVRPLRSSAAVTARFPLPRGHVLHIFRRQHGEPWPDSPVSKTFRRSWTDAGLKPGTTYDYRAALIDRAGNRVTEYTREIQATTRSRGEARWIEACAVPVMVVIYTNPEASSGEIDSDTLRAALDLVRDFTFRNTKGRFFLDPFPLRIDAPLPDGPGPTVEIVMHDLMIRGLLEQTGTLIHVIAPGTEINCGGLAIGHGCVLSIGSTAFRPAPFEAPREVRNLCWTLIHELQHSLAQLANSAQSTARMLSGHFLDNFPLPNGETFDAGDCYDGQAEVLRRFFTAHELPPTWHRALEALDGDGDGMPDEDHRWPVDERRLGTRIDRTDTDRDGLDDLAEHCVGIYAGSDPLVPDTDRDGLLDGQDPFPLSTFSGSIPQAVPDRDELPPGLLSSDVVHRSAPGAPGELEVRASWDQEALYLGFEAGEPLHVIIHLDGSGKLGPFQSDVHIVSPPQAEWVPGDDRRQGDVYTNECALRATFGDPFLYKGATALPGRLVRSWTRDERYRMCVTIPRVIGPGTARCFIGNGTRSAPGLTLKAGRKIGLNFSIFPVDPALPGTTGPSAERPPSLRGEEALTGSWSSVYELHRFYDAELESAR